MTEIYSNLDIGEKTNQNFVALKKADNLSFAVKQFNGGTRVCFVYVSNKLNFIVFCWSCYEDGCVHNDNKLCTKGNVFIQLIEDDTNVKLINFKNRKGNDKLAKIGAFSQNNCTTFILFNYEIKFQFEENEQIQICFKKVNNPIIVLWPDWRSYFKRNRYTAVDIGIDAEVQFLRRVLFQRDCFVTAALPFGYASFSIFKIGGGFDHTDTSIALGLSGASVGMGLLALPFLRMNKPKWLFGHSILLSTLSLATTFAFYKIDKISGLCTLPFSFLSLYYMGLWGKTVCCGAKTSTV